MINNDLRSSGSTDVKLEYSKYNNVPAAKSKRNSWIIAFAWFIAVFSSGANLTLMAIKYVYPITNNDTTMFINISLMLILFICCVVVNHHVK